MGAGLGGLSLQDAGDGPALGVGRSVTGRAWRWRGGDERAALAMAQRLDLPEIVGRLLAARGVGPEEAADFLAPTLRAALPDPSVLVDMDIAAERLARAVQASETVAIFGDYDVDGGCATALLAGLLGELGCGVLTHIPDRTTEGYGPNAPAMRALWVRGASLIVCVDCGMAAADVFAAHGTLTEVIVLDHHKAEGPPPPVLATVNPNRLDDASGLGGVCATTIAFLAAVALVRALRRSGFFAGRSEPDLLATLDLVALATVCDVMPLVGLNRALVAQGLKVLGQRRRPGLAALMAVARVAGQPNAMTLGWALGPRINAGGRVADSALGLRLLLSGNEAEAMPIAAQLDAVNQTRQDVEAEMLGFAMEEARLQFEAGHACALVARSQLHPGVVGIVAGRIRERFNRPAAVAGLADGVAKGSARGVFGFDLGAAIIAARQSGLLMAGGGHALAAGFMLREEGLAALHAFLDARFAGARALPAVEDLVVEAGVSVAGATIGLAEAMARLAPFGAGNEEPVVAMARARVVRADRVGKEGTSVRCFIEPEAGGGRLKAMLFGARAGRAREEALAARLLARDGRAMHLAGHLRVNNWMGEAGVDFVVVDAAEVGGA